MSGNRGIHEKALQRMDEIAPRLKVLSEVFADGAGVDPEDLQQEFFLTFIGRQESNPDFLDQKDAYLLGAARFRAMHAKTNQNTCRKHTVSFRRACDVSLRGHGELAGEEEEPWEDLLPAEQPSTEDLVCQRETIADLFGRIRRLSPENQRMIRLFTLGYSGREIAALFGVTPQAISSRRKYVALVLGADYPDRVRPRQNRAVKFASYQPAEPTGLVSIFRIHRSAKADRDLLRALSSLRVQEYRVAYSWFSF